jgi:hypothetical protein
MKTPRIQDFDPSAAERQLRSPLDGMPVIEKPRPKPQTATSRLMKTSTDPEKQQPLVKIARRYVRRTFDYFEDQIEYLTRISLEERLAGRNVTMASMLREALDRYIAEKSAKK